MRFINPQTEERNPNIDKMPFDQVVVDGYDRFARMLSQYDGRDIREARKALYPIYGNTYFYDYYLMSDLPQY